MAEAMEWVAEHGSALAGLAAEDAAARVRAASLSPRVLLPDSVRTLEYRSGRVNLLCDADGTVTKASAG